MQLHPDFIFHLDEPSEQPAFEAVPLRGWIAAHCALTNIRLRGEAERPLALPQRPDVQMAFPNYAFTTGFSGNAGPRDLLAGALHFSFAVGGATRNAIAHLPPPPRPPPWAPRMWAGLRQIVERVRLQRATDSRRRWNAARELLLIEIKINRNTGFRRAEANRLLALFAEHFPKAVVLQIGANDGVAGDPLAELFLKTDWTGLLVEPVPDLYEALVARSRERPGVQVARVAVSDRDGEAPLYRLRAVPGKTPEWFQQLATLDRDVLLKHRPSIPEIDSLLIEERVPTARLNTLLSRYRLERIDLLVVDTEGHDYQILRQIDFSRYRPAVLIFEHQHLTPGDKASAYALLRTNGYTWAETSEGDAIAWRPL